MNEHLQKTYFSEIVNRCESCFQAVAELNTILAEANSERDLFVPARELICQAGLVSKLLWPPGGRNKKSRARAFKRGEALRKTLDLNSNHAVKNRALRDHFEHYDERLDAWADESANRNMVKRLVGPRNCIGGSGIGDGDIIEHYDPELKTLAFRGEHFDIQELVDGMNDIYSRAKPFTEWRHDT